jgi:diguanylate cyclase (GGDEF)-like protein
MRIHGRGATAEVPVASLPTGPGWLRSGAWLIFLIVGLGLGVGGGLIDDQGELVILLTAAGLATTVAILIGIHVNHPPRHLPWQLLAVCILLTTVAALFVTAPGELGLISQVMTGVGALFGIVGLGMLIRGRIPGGDRAAILDSAILISGAGALIWSVGLAPYVISEGQSSVVLAAFFYPALVALAAVARMWFLRGAHRPATRLLVLFVLAANGIIVLYILKATIGQATFAGLYNLAGFAVLTFVGAAALHPSMALAPERQLIDQRPISRGRLVALTAALLVNPATVLIEVAAGRTLDPAPYLIGGVVIGLLVVARLADALGQLGESIHERDSLMELLRRQALYDALTSLPNRAYFTERLAAEYANRSPDRLLAVLLIDLDNFKAVNDTYGHEAGDALLLAVGQRLRGAIRDGDMAARLGGDEFVIALPACQDADIATRVAERVLTSLGEPFDIAGRSLMTHASIGVAVAGADDRTAEDLVRNADVAMYRAKSHGKSRVEVFEPSMQAAAMTQLQLRADLAAGIADGDLRLHYQPVVDLRTGRTVGYEALVRWMHDGILVAPGEFIPIAESTGLIGPLTDWVIDEACRTTAASAVTGPRPWVSVNLSSSQLVRPDFVARLGRTLETSGLPPDRLVVEITESSLLEIEVAKPAVERLSSIGVRVAIDDFGIGYSTLSYLARLPIDIVKIDRSFVVALQHAGPEEAIASAIIALAKRLGLTTIGEGIETVAQLDQLATLGCDLGQGFYLGRPSPNQEVPAVPVPHVRGVRQPSLGSLIA